MHQHYSVMTRSIRGRTCMCVCEVWKLQQENGILSSVYESNRSQVSGCYYCVCYNLLFFWVWWDRIGWFYWALQHAHICILYLYLSLSVCLCKCSYLCVCVCLCMSLHVSEYLSMSVFEYFLYLYLWPGGNSWLRQVFMVPTDGVVFMRRVHLNRPLMWY